MQARDEPGIKLDLPGVVGVGKIPLEHVSWTKQARAESGIQLD